MIRSMTGFGHAEQATELWRCGVEVRSVNARFLDVRIKVPPGLSQLEEALQKLVRGACERGKVDCTITLSPLDEGARTFRINKGLAQQYGRLLRELRETVHTAFDIGIGDLVNTRDLVQQVSFEEQSEQVTGLIQETLTGALAQLNGMREREGEATKADLLARVGELRTQMEQIVPLTQGLPDQYARKLRDNLARLVEGPLASEERILQEIGIFADRCDVSEEITRFTTHLSHLEALLAEGGAVGRKVEFLLQELNREINTLVNKANEAEVSARGVEVKSILEKLREQIQNIE